MAPEKILATLFTVVISTVKNKHKSKPDNVAVL